MAGDGPAAAALVEMFYGTFVERVVPVSSPKVSEAVKITENIFRAVNIALVNELKVVYDAMGIDIWEVIDAAATKPFGFMPFYPGPGLGGHCIPIDPFYLTWKSREYGLPTRFIELAGEINVAMPRYVASRLEEALDRAAGGVARRRPRARGRTGLQEERLGHPREPVPSPSWRSSKSAVLPCRLSRSARGIDTADARAFRPRRAVNRWNSRPESSAATTR